MSTDIHSAVSGDIDDPEVPVVVLCHGSMDRSGGMLRLSRQLDDDAAVIRYDRRGYAKSAAAGSPYTVAQHCADLAAVIERHAPGRQVSVAFGHSFGGNVVLGLAASEPELIQRVAVYETPMSWFDWWPRNTAGGAAVSAAGPEDAAEIFMRRLIGDERWERLPEATRAGRRGEGVAMSAELSDLRRGAPWEAASIVCPVLAIGGEHGRPHHQRGMQVLAELIDGGEYQRLSGAGHSAPNTHPVQLAEIIVEQLKRPARQPKPDR